MRYYRDFESKVFLHIQQQQLREEAVAARALENGVPLLYVNMVGGQDELVFDGQSVVVAASGEVLARASAFREELLVVDIEAAAGSAGVAVSANGAEAKGCKR